MNFRYISVAVFFLAAFSARASQSEQYRGTLHRTPSGMTLEFNDGSRIALSGLDASFAQRHDGQVATVEGDLTYPSARNEPPVLQVERITVTAPRYRSVRGMDDYRPPANSEERAADTVKNVVPFLF